MSKIKILFVFGTRPEAIKMAPVVNAFQNEEEWADAKVCVTAQHRQMLDQVLSFFEITPDYDLNLMKPNQTLYDVTSNVILGLRTVLEDFNPEYVMVHGDTTTTMAASIAAFYSGAKVCHVEAGLRTFNKKSPFPEEINRQVTGRITDIHFAPTNGSHQNLVNENVSEGDILVTGNTVIDALLSGIDRLKTTKNREIEKLESKIDFSRRIVLVTGHRRENFGDGFLNICHALKEISDAENVQIVYPVHLNPNVQGPVYDILGNVDNITLIEPLAYEEFIWLMNKSYIIITDSGGVQEEAPSLGKPVLVMRDTTERPEAVDAGTVLLVGTNREVIVEKANQLLTDPNFYKKMSEAHNPYGDGKASKRIVEHIKNISLK